MSYPLDELTPDESLRADNQIKLLKLELEHDVRFNEFDEATPPADVGEFLDSLFAFEAMHKNLSDRGLITERCDAFIQALAQQQVTALIASLDSRFLMPDPATGNPIVLPEVATSLDKLVDSWWPRSPHGGSVADIQFHGQGEIAQAELLVCLGLDDDPDLIDKPGTAYLGLVNDSWTIQKIVFDDWQLG
ncbi:hypothetical protein [Fibrella arboris]|uniref:hypothetical protein n=1 Tax=Fibrella arboris TaxID=3242486 RepID=UPI0035202830